MTVLLRHEVLADIEIIEKLVADAFRNAPHTTHREQFIVNSLREDDQLSLSLVAVEDERIVGHLAASPVFIDGNASSWFGLGPISVAPDRQGIGVGSQMIRHALLELRRGGASGCVLLGDPHYYGRFGFIARTALLLPGVPNEYFQALAFHNGVPQGTVEYHKAFHSI